MSDQAPPPPPPAPPAYAPPAPGQMYVGKVRSTGICMLLFIVTLGFYGWYWWYQVHEDMKRHTGQGLGGALGLVLAIVTWIGLPVAPFFSSDEVGKLYERVGYAKPVSALTGLWYFPGAFLIVLPIVWFMKTNGALNAYWRGYGAPG
jgi:hypothetical protein